MSAEYPRQSIRIHNRIRPKKEITIRIRENYGYPQNIYPWIHIRASLVVTKALDLETKTKTEGPALETEAATSS